jgi:sporulation protein YlmC with PRC-barrel domain
MTTQVGVLRRLSDIDSELVDVTADLRGRKVIDADGEEFGTVEDLLVDQDQGRVRFMEVATGGFLGLGKDRFVVPVEAISAIGEDEVRLARLKAEVAESPPFAREYEGSGGGHEYWGRIYTHYGYSPYWEQGYTEPPYSSYQRRM